MNRLLLAAFIVLLAGPLSAADSPPAGVDMTLEQVSEHVYFVQGVPGVATDNAGFISNAGVIVTVPVWWSLMRWVRRHCRSCY